MNNISFYGLGVKTGWRELIWLNLAPLNKNHPARQQPAVTRIDPFAIFMAILFLSAQISEPAAPTSLPQPAFFDGLGERD